MISSQWCSLNRLLKCLPMTSLQLESTLLVSMMISTNKYYMALIHKYSHENRDVRVQFVKKNGLFLYWFEEDSRNQYWIPLQHIIFVVQVPTPHGSSARKYLLHKSDFENVKQLLPSNIKFE